MNMQLTRKLFSLFATATLLLQATALAIAQQAEQAKVS
jgi:hypothetical protein